MYISQKASVTVDSVNASSNSATAGKGGFVYITVSGSTLTVKSGTIGENTVSAAGAGSETLWSNSASVTVAFGSDLEYPMGTVAGVSGFNVKILTEE